MLPPRYDDQKAIESAESRHRERHFGHRRALMGHDRTDSIVSRVVGRLVSLRSATTKRAALAAEEHEMTDYVCRLEDGTMGRVAIRESDGEWIGVCVRAA